MKSCQDIFGTHHMWGQWVTKEEGKIQRRLSDKEKQDIGNYIVQTRKCSMCGYIQLDRQDVTL